MMVLYRTILFLLFLLILFVSMRLNTKSSLLIIISTALVLYGLSELSSYLKEKWFPTKPSMIVSEDGTRGLRISDQGQIQTAILQPHVEIKSAKLIDSRTHPNFHSQKYPFLYIINFEFIVSNGVKNNKEIILTQVFFEIFDINGHKSKILSDVLKYDETINPETYKNISTNANNPIFLGYHKEIRSCKFRIRCGFSNFKQLESNEFIVSIE